MLDDLRTQEKMNIVFIKKLPLTVREVYKELMVEPITGEFSVLGAGLVPSKEGFDIIGNEPRLPKEEGVFMR